MTNICIFGDSITWGAVDPEGGGWATRLRNYFESKGQRVDQDIDIYNLGVSSDNTDDLLKRFQNEMLARKPTITVFAIGINDASFVISENRNRVPIEKFRNNMNALLSEIKHFGVKGIIVGITRVDESKTAPIPWDTDRKYLNTEIEKYDLALEEIAEQEKIKYIDVSKVLTEDDLHDGLHPNVSGHQKLFEVIRNEIEKIL